MAINRTSQDGPPHHNGTSQDTSDDGQGTHRNENEHIFLLSNDLQEECEGSYIQEDNTKQELLYNIDLEIEEFRARLLSVLNISQQQITQATVFCEDEDSSSAQASTSTIEQISHTVSGGDQENGYLGSICNSGQLFPDSTYMGANTPDSGLDSSFADAGDLCTPLSSQSSGEANASADALYYLDSESDLTHCLVHLLTLASAISLVLQRSEYTV